jgi:hypothetical protein
LDLEVLLSILRNLPTSRLFIADKNVRSRCGSSLKVTLTEEGVVPLIDVGALRRENQRSVNGGILDAVCRDAEKYNLFAKALWKHVLDEIVTSEISINTSQPPFSIEYAETGYLLDDDNEADKHLIDTTTQNDCAQLSILSLTQNASERNYFGPQYIILPETAQNISAANRIKMQHLIACLYQHHHDRIAITADSKYIANFLKNAKQKSDVAYRPVVDLRQLDRYRIAEDTNDGKFSCDAVLSLVPDELKSLSPLAFKNRFAKILLRGMQVLLSPIQDGRLGLINMAIPENIIIADEGHELQVAAGSLNSLNAAFENYFHAHFAADQVADREDKSPSCYAYAVLKSLSDYLGEWNNCYEIFLKRIRDDPLMESGPSPMGLFCNRPGVYYVVSRLQQLMDFCAAEREMSRIQDTLDRLARAFQVLAISLQACEVGRFEGVTTLLAILASGDSSFQSLLLKDEVDVLMHMSIEARFNYVSSKVPVGLRMFPGFAPHAKLSFRRALGRMYGVTAAEDPHSGDMVFFGAILLSARKQGVPTSFRPEKEHGDMFYYDNLTAEAKRNCQQLIRLIMEPGAVMRTFVENALSHSAAQRFLREKHRLPDAQISILLRSPDTKRQVIADMLKEYGYLMEKH